MQQLSRRLICQSSVRDLLRNTLLAQKAAIPAVALHPERLNLPEQVICNLNQPLSLFHGSAPKYSTRDRLLDRHSTNTDPRATFATKAEDYDLIVAEAGLVRIEGYDSTGFIVNDIQVQGAVFCIADFFTLWDLKSWQDVTPDSLSLLQLYKPAPDLVIIGCGLHSQLVPPKLQAYFRQHNIAYEAIDTANAVSTFNILNQEGRKVAGVLLPAGSS